MFLVWLTFISNSFADVILKCVLLTSKIERIEFVISIKYVLFNRQFLYWCVQICFSHRHLFAGHKLFYSLTENENHMQAYLCRCGDALHTEIMCIWNINGWRLLLLDFYWQLYHFRLLYQLLRKKNQSQRLIQLINMVVFCASVCTTMLRERELDSSCFERQIDSQNLCKNNRLTFKLYRLLARKLFRFVNHSLHWADLCFSIWYSKATFYDWNEFLLFSFPETAMGVSINCLAKPKSPYVMAVHE